MHFISFEQVFPGFQSQVLTWSMQVGQNQSPSGTWVILGFRQYM